VQFIFIPAHTPFLHSVSIEISRLCVRFMLFRLNIFVTGIFLRKINAHVEYPSEGLRRNCSFIKINICTRVNTWYYFGIEFYSGYAEKNLLKRI
jgi:hypothetical protein